MKIEVWGKEIDLKCSIDKYVSNGTLAVQLWHNYHPYARLTINIPNSSDYLDPDCAYIDVNNFAEAIELITKYELGVMTGRSVVSGYCCYPECRFDMDKLKEVSI